MIDEYISGVVERISPEAPVPVLRVEKESSTLGGSGNVVKNLSELGISSLVFGKIGKDGKGQELIKLLKSQKLHKDSVILETALPTITKTRIIAGTQQICRIDREDIQPLTPSEEEKILSSLKAQMKNVSAILVSDYDKGFFSDSIISEISKLVKEHSVKVFVDPQVRNFWKYKHSFLQTPNHNEAGAALGKKLDSNESVESALREIAQRLDSPYSMITRGAKGMSIFEASTNRVLHLPTVAKEVFDVTGAGDTVISVLAGFISAGADVFSAMEISNLAAGIVVGKKGAATASLSELEKAYFL